MKKYVTLALSHPLKIVGAVAASTIVGALIIEALGFPPCTLCLYQRKPFYVICTLLALAALFSKTRLFAVSYRPLLWTVMLAFVISAGLGVFHAGVEFAWWEGPKGCSGSLDTTNINSLLETLKNTKAVSCTKASIWIFGLSLSVWNAIISSGIVLFVAGALVSKAGKA